MLIQYIVGRLTLETSVLESLNGGQFTSSPQLIKLTKLSCYTSHRRSINFFRNVPPLFIHSIHAYASLVWMNQHIISSFPNRSLLLQWLGSLPQSSARNGFLYFKYIYILHMHVCLQTRLEAETNIQYFAVES